MGKNNRQRRAAKNKRASRSGPSGRDGRSSPDRSPGSFDGAPAPDVPDGVLAEHRAAGDPRLRQVLESGDEAQLHRLRVDTTCGVFWRQLHAPFEGIRSDRLASEAARHHEQLGGPERTAVQRQIASWCAAQLPAAWVRNWTPDDLVQLCRRELDADHATLLTHVMVQQVALTLNTPAMPSLWREQLEVLADDAGLALDERTTVSERGWFERSARRSGLDGARLWSAALHLIRLFTRVSTIEAVCPPPSEWIVGLPTERDDGSIDAKLLHRVRSLLAKAESTTFEEEADSLTAKAQELMARHAIDQAMVDRRRPTSRVLPQVRRVWLDNPYADNKSVLLARVAGANRAEAVFTPRYGFTTVVGFAADLEVVDLLFTSLLVQGSAAVKAAGTVKDRHGVSRTRSFRSTFWLSYAIRIGERLEQTNDEVLHEAVAEHGTSLLPVLARREEEVHEALAAAFPNISQKAVRFSNEAGYHAGRMAADQADLAVGRRLTPTG